MKKIGILGAGFTGTMTATQLLRKSGEPIELVVIDELNTGNGGVAFNPYSKIHLLNVIAAKMSAFPDDPDHFLDWVLSQPDYKGKDRTLVANAFLPRALYGKYLNAIWKETIKNASGTHKIRLIDSLAIDIDVLCDNISLQLKNGEKIDLDYCVIATGNNIPGNPKIRNADFYKSKNYFQNPWQKSSVEVRNNLTKPVLIIGNGLTMVDTVLGLLENDFDKEIYSISPNGFNILPHRHNGVKYTSLVDELPQNPTLFELVSLIRKHIKSVRQLGISAEPIIDSIRPYTQKIWQNFSTAEKNLFLKRFRHLWGVARHRIPTNIHDKIQQLRIDGKLLIKSGRIIDITESEDGIIVEYYNKKLKVKEKIEVCRVINCTGPESNLENLENTLLSKALSKGTITQDELKLGLRADIESFRVINSNGEVLKNHFVLGSNLKGELWETTAVNELRAQAEKLAENLTVNL
jgi:uncharacterized NAD(P)/FAD-binding protein YdhS